MSSKFTRRLSYAAILSTSLSGLALAGQAHATSGGVASSSPLTIDNNGQVQTADGVSVSNVSGARGLAWSPDGSKVVYENGTSITVADPNGAGSMRVATGSGDALSDHPVYAFDGEEIVFSAVDPTTGHHTLYSTLANHDYNDWTGSPDWGQMTRIATPSGSDDIRPDYGGGAFAFERVTGGVSSIYVRAYGSPLDAYEVAAGSRPTVSPDGRTVAFVAPDTAGQDQIWTVPTDAPAGGVLATPVQQTQLSGVSVQQAVYTPDRSSITFLVKATDTGAYSVRTVAVTTTSTPNQDSEVPTAVALGATTSLSFRTEFPKAVNHVAGDDRFGTAVAASQTTWRDNGDTSDVTRGQAAVAVLSRSDTFADALGGAGLAAHKGGPLLLTESGSLDPSVLAEMQRILPQGSTVYLLGGTGALSPAVEAAVRQAGFTPSRIAGATRYETSVAVAEVSVPGTPANILIATGNNFPDALSAGAAAAIDPNAVVVLTDDKKMPAATGSYLQSFYTDFKNGPKLWAVGGQAVSAIDTFGAGTWYRVPEKGNTRYDTSLMLAHDFFGEMESVGFATGLNFPDSLGGGAVMGEQFGPLLLVDPATGLTADEKAFLAANRGEISQAFLFGGQIANSNLINQQVANAIGGPMGVVTNEAGQPMSASGSEATASQHEAPKTGHGPEPTPVRP